MQRALVDYERLGEIARITLNNPEKRNVLSRMALEQLIGCLEAAEADGQVKCVILRAAGTAFSAGHDLREIIDATDADRPLRIGGSRQPSPAVGVQVVGTRAYVAVDSRHGLQILDISDPANPVRVGATYTMTPARAVRVRDSFAFVANAHRGRRNRLRWPG